MDFYPIFDICKSNKITSRAWLGKLRFHVTFQANCNLASLRFIFGSVSISLPEVVTGNGDK